jgi:hypothetical protein
MDVFYIENYVKLEYTSLNLRRPYGNCFTTGNLYYFYLTWPS